MVTTSFLFWGGVLVVSVFAAHWGAERLAEPLKKIRKQWGLTAVAGGAFVGLAAASPEIGINAVSASRGVADIGLGVMFGSNIVAIPLIVTTAYFATRSRQLASKSQGESSNTQSNGGGSEHKRHVEERLLRVRQEAVPVLALPYLGILLLVAVLTVPNGWRGLQPIDGWIMGGVYLVFLGQAVIRGREESENVQWKAKEIGLAVAGLAVLALGAYGTVRATENIVAALGISNLIGGLFITAIMAATPEVFATWSVTRSGQVTSGVTSVIGDHAVTMTVAFLPLALVTVPVENFRFFWVNLVFVAAMPAAYAALLHWGSSEHGFKRWEVVILDGIYLLYVGVIAFWVLNLV